MNSQDLNLIYERVICQCYNCKRGDIDEADAMIMDSLLGAFCDSFNTQNPRKLNDYQNRCRDMSDILSKAIDESKMSQSEKLKSLLKDADIFGIIFVLGQMYQDLTL